MINFLKLSTILILSFGIVNKVSAKLIHESDFNFKANIDLLLKGHIQFSYLLDDNKNIPKVFPSIYILDHSKSLKKKDSVIFATKSFYLIKKEFGLFDLDLSKNQIFIENLSGSQKVSKIKENKYQVFIDGDNPYNYLMDVYFDSDDISSSSKLKKIHSINVIKKLDISNQGSTASLVRDFSQYSQYGYSGKQMHLFSSFNDQYTLVTTYTFHFLKDVYAQEKILLHHYFNEVKAQKDFLNNFK